jgi:hypothetical protein
MRYRATNMRVLSVKHHVVWRTKTRRALYVVRRYVENQKQAA